jgi:radical SAM superfamily enzyme YgiQ (UPF0313 family)
MKIKLVSPARKPEWGENFWDFKTLCKLTGRISGGAPLALPTLAALTPSDVEVILTDENIEPVNFDEGVDLVGVTGMTCLIARSYEIADEYRRRGVPVVMGGVHVSMLPEEAIEHCDSVVIGEAEEIWERVVRDAQKKNLQKFYRADEQFPDLTNSPIPRWDLLKNDKYLYFIMQTGRGCPYDCEFCLAKVFNGRKYRHKRIEQVVEEIKIIQEINPEKSIFFADDNLLSVPQYAEELFKAIKPLKLMVWWCQSSVNKLKDGRLLDLMYEAGCRVVFIGFESISQERLGDFNKSHVNKVAEYEQVIKRVHSKGIGIFGSFILGSDNDSGTNLKDIVDFIMENNIAFSMSNILTPLPGSKLFQRLEKENRIISKEWWEFNGDKVCFRPKLLSAKSLQKGQSFVLKEIYSYDKLYKRLQNLWEMGVFRVIGTQRKLTKERILATFLNLFCLDFKRIGFSIKGLWFHKPTSIVSVLIALNLHDYVDRLEDNLEKENE